MEKYSYAVLGGGRQGLASAYDLARFGDASEIRLADCNPQVAQRGARRLNDLLGGDLVKAFTLDAGDEAAVTEFLKPVDGVLVAVPFRLIPIVTRAVLAAQVHATDMGGHTQTVRWQLEQTDRALAADIALVPDCGMGPGMNITMALLAMEQMDQPLHVHIYDGGLPQNPVPPWNYAQFFHINGLTNEYDGVAFFLDQGKVTEVPCFERQEEVIFPDPIGGLEAAVTSGGLSTMPWTFAGKLQSLENKTLRYPGHWEWMRAYRELGLFSEEPVSMNGGTIIPREFYHHLFTAQLPHDVPDVCLMRVICTGMHQGRKWQSRVETAAQYNPDTGFLAMEQWTGWHASIFLILAVQGQIPRGVVSVENAVSGSTFLKEARRRSYEIEVSSGPLEN